MTVEFKNNPSSGNEAADFCRQAAIDPRGETVVRGMLFTLDAVGAIAHLIKQTPHILRREKLHSTPTPVKPHIRG